MGPAVPQPWSGSEYAGSAAGRTASVAMVSVVPLVRQSNRSECSAQLLGAFDGSLQ